jgi:hypothetical protein
MDLCRALCQCPQQANLHNSRGSSTNKSLNKPIHKKLRTILLHQKGRYQHQVALYWLLHYAILTSQEPDP